MFNVEQEPDVLREPGRILAAVQMPTPGQDNFVIPVRLK